MCNSKYKHNKPRPMRLIFVFPFLFKFVSKYQTFSQFLLNTLPGKKVQSHVIGVGLVGAYFEWLPCTLWPNVSHRWNSAYSYSRVPSSDLSSSLFFFFSVSLFVNISLSNIFHFSFGKKNLDVSFCFFFLSQGIYLGW